MGLKRRGRRRDGAKANIDMNSLIDLTFLLLVVFIVTLPTLEHAIQVNLPIGKTEKPRDDKKKTLQISVDPLGKTYFGEAPVTLDDLKARFEQAVKEDPETSVLIRGDEKADYGSVYEVVKIAKNANVKHLGLVSREN